MKKLFLAAILAALFSGCSSDPGEAIIGTWACRDTSEPHIYLCDLTFYDNDRFTDGDEDMGTFIISGNVLHLDFDDYERTTLNFRLQGNRLTISSGNDINIVLSRQ